MSDDDCVARLTERMSAELEFDGNAVHLQLDAERLPVDVSIFIWIGLEHMYADSHRSALSV